MWQLHGYILQLIWVIVYEEEGYWLWDVFKSREGVGSGKVYGEAESGRVEVARDVHGSRGG